MVTHIILGYSPFKVRFIEPTTKATVDVTFAVVLTSAEIKAQYDYIEFKQQA